MNDSKVIEILKEMMKDRNHEKWEASSLSPDVYLSDDTLIFLSRTEKFNIETVKNVVFWLQEHKYKHALVVYQNIITSLAKKAIEHLQEFTIETFERKELLFNPTRHRFYCPHKLLTKEELNNELKVNLNCLPILLRSDIIARYFGFRKGEVVRIERKNGSIAYRLVR